MFRVLNGFLAFILIMAALKWFAPAEAADLANEILIMILSIIRDILSGSSLPQ
jgi:hypothetical protein